MTGALPEQVKLTLTRNGRSFHRRNYPAGSGHAAVKAPAQSLHQLQTVAAIQADSGASEWNIALAKCVLDQSLARVGRGWTI
jgi:hypothetical protein